MSKFEVTYLAGQRALVKGKGGNTTILSTEEWDLVKHKLAHRYAYATFDAAVSEFFAPLVEAAEIANEIIDASIPQPDPDFVIVLEEGELPTPEKISSVLVLGRDAAILRMIEEGNTDRLIWVNGELEIVAI